jgi:MerR family transcriptional regulator, light-induced transcriptional regulator
VADSQQDSPDELSLQAAADLLGVHYMTAYRYVRTGRLVAERRGNQWYVPSASLASMRAASPPGRHKRGSRSAHRDYPGQLATLLTEGDEAEAWRLAQDALASAFTAEQLYLDVLAPAMRFVGDEWKAGRISVAEEHRASALAYRIVGRLGPSFTRRGPTRGLIVLGTPTGDRHGFATALLADPLRGRGFTVADLGADTPAASFAEIVTNDARARAVGLAVSVAVGDDVISETIDAIHSARPVPVLLGGRAIKSAAHAQRLGAEAYSDTAANALTWFDAINPTG